MYLQVKGQQWHQTKSATVKRIEQITNFTSRARLKRLYRLNVSPGSGIIPETQQGRAFGESIIE
jgi:hypothetical protein